MIYKSASLWLLLLTLSMIGLSFNTAQASDQELITIGLSGGGGGGEDDDASGTAVVVSYRGPDIFLLTTRGLEPRTRYTVFLTENPTPAFLPAQFIGEFRTDGHGNGRLALNAEIVRAFASANQSLEDDQGIANVPGAGGLANGANTIALNWIRVYLAEGDANVFGPNEAEFGGGIALTSDEALP